jgi:hypothetical protein
VKKKRIKDNSFKSALHFSGTGAEYARSMIAPQDEKMYDWLNERIRVGRFGTKQMTQFIEYALDNPTPEFFAYVLRKFLRHFGVDDWSFDYKFNPESYETYLKYTAELSIEELKIATDPIDIKRHKKNIADWEKWQDNHKRYLKFVECFLHDEDWSPEQELEIGKRRSEVKQESSRLERIRYYYHDLLGDYDFEPDSYFPESKMSEEFKQWENNAPRHFLELVRNQTQKKTTKDLLDEAEGRAQKIYSSNRDVIYYERMNNDKTTKRGLSSDD